MRNMSFMLTIAPMQDEIKDVTRRNGWWYLLKKDLQSTEEVIMAVEKCQGLKRGDKIVPIHPIQILSARAEQLCALTENLEYGYSEVIREGFPNLHPWQFVEMFCDTHKGVTPESEVNRIEFRRHHVQNA
jgi:hypothetical protein